jgi:Predicted membrane protein (DUF2254)
MLVDIAERSISDSPLLDPTTAVQAIDRLHDCLRQLAPRPFPDGRYRDEQGEVRLVTPSMTWEDYVHLAFDEIRLAGAESPQVTRRLSAALQDLQTIAPPNGKAFCGSSSICCSWVLRARSRKRSTVTISSARIQADSGDVLPEPLSTGRSRVATAVPDAIRVLHSPCRDSATIRRPARWR